MARTIIGLNDPKAVKKYSAFLAVDVARTSYFNRKFMGEGAESLMPIQRLTHLENEAGELITYDLVMQLKMKPVECMKRPIENNSSPGQAVYDPFLGSGTPLIAAEMTGRV